MRHVYIFTIALFCLLPAFLQGQGISNGGITGIVQTTGEKGLSEANITAIHKPSGTQYTTVTQSNGRYNLSNLRVGGPYQIVTSHVGFKKHVKDSVYVKLGEAIRLNFQMVEEATDLSTVDVASISPTLKGTETGIGTQITESEINNLPTLDRSFTDFTRLTPQKGEGLSFAGRNNFYNNLTVDGSLFNNSFGLAPLPGGQTNAQPISLDAIKGIQVNLSPYDVMQSGFTGAGMNLITRSGSNQFQASAYSYFRSDELIGNKVDETKVETQEFNRQQYGFRASGPIVKDKLFFFVNAEVTRRIQPASEFRANRPGISGPQVSSVEASELEGLRNFLINEYDYDPGRYEGYNYATENEKVLFKLDWNINPQHKLSFRYNTLLSRKDRPYFDAISGDQNTLPFENSAYEQHNNLHSGILKLNSSFGGKYSNELTLGYTGIRDFRDIKGEPFPAVQIGESLENATTIFGVDPFTGKNAVNQDIFQFSNNFRIYEGNHTLTIGTSNRYFDFSNLFVDYFYGRYQYADLDAFYNSARHDSANGNYLMKYSTDPDDPAPEVDMRALQLGFYVQDEWQPKDQLKLTGGLRVDVPFFPVDLPENPEVADKTFRNGREIDVSEMPDPKPHWSPRLGLNYQFGKEEQFQLRTGSGIFTGRPRFVWLTNQAGNTGTMFGNVGGQRAFEPSREAYLPENRTGVQMPEINKTDEDFKFPQVWRSSLGLDYKLPFWGLTATGEFIYSKDINAVVHRDANLAEPSGQLPGADNRPQFPENPRINDDISNAFVMSNTSKGRQYNITASLKKKPEDGLGGQISYTYGNAKDLTSNPNSIALFAYGYNRVKGNPNKPEVSWSAYDTRHRVVGALSYSHFYADHLKSTISLVYNGQTGPRYSYFYTGDVNRDGLFLNNDLIYVPANQSQINLVQAGPDDSRSTDEIWQQLDAFIEQDDYLKAHRGEIVERNGGHLPWFNQLDLKFMQDIYLETDKGDKHTLQLSLDLINVGNMINSAWGMRKQVTNQSFLSFKGYNDEGEPEFAFLLKGNGEPLQSSFQNRLDVQSRWRAQIGIRYLFN